MARRAHESNSGLSDLLLAQTADVRHQLQHNPLFARTFSSPVDVGVYRHVLTHFYGYYQLLELLLSQRPEWRRFDLPEMVLEKSQWLAADLAIIGPRAIPTPSLSLLPPIRNEAEALGVTFFTEFLAWNSEVAEKHLQLALPRRYQKATRFVRAYGRSRHEQWLRVQQWLNGYTSEDIATVQVIQAARRSFFGLNEWFTDSITYS